MKLEHRVTVNAPAEAVWALLMDVPRASALIPGVEGVRAVEGDRFQGQLRVQVGPVKLSFEGNISIEDRDDQAHIATLRGEGADRRAGGGVRALVRLEVTAASEQQADVVLSTDIQLGGRIGELGQPLIKRKADQTLEQFAVNLRTALAR